jgi:hypothetical protein
MFYSVHIATCSYLLPDVDFFPQRYFLNKFNFSTLCGVFIYKTLTIAVTYYVMALEFNYIDNLCLHRPILYFSFEFYFFFNFGLDFHFITL